MAWVRPEFMLHISVQKNQIMGQDKYKLYISKYMHTCPKVNQPKRNCALMRETITLIRNSVGMIFTVQTDRHYFEKKRIYLEPNMD